MPLSIKKMQIDNFNNFLSIGNEYMAQVGKLTNKKIITDKLPINFKWIGFIKAIFPKAKIIHCVRNSKDTCLSIYKNYFTNSELNYAYNLEELVFFYNLYTDLMNFWNSLIPESIIQIRYEKLVSNPKKEIKYLIKSCDLNWEENCMQFYKNMRPIKTASDSQARKKIYKDSVDSWKRYKKNLDIYFSKLVV